MHYFLLQVRKIAEETLPGVYMQICGSYRRGRTHCGDIDILFSHPNDELRKSFLKAVLDKLKEDGIITDDLICVQSEEQRKYMGVCKLPGENTKVSTILQLLNYNYLEFLYEKNG